MSDENEVRRELDAAARRARRQLREDKVRHLCWYLTEGRVTDDVQAIDRAAELAKAIQIVDMLIKEDDHK